MFEAVQYVDVRGEPEPQATLLGETDSWDAAVAMARQARIEFLAPGSDEYAWWVVKEQGAELAQFIADSKSDKEFVLDLTSGELVEVT